MKFVSLFRFQTGISREILYRVCGWNFGGIKLPRDFFVHCSLIRCACPHLCPQNDKQEKNYRKKDAKSSTIMTFWLIPQTMVKQWMLNCICLLLMPLPLYFLTMQTRVKLVCPWVEFLHTLIAVFCNPSFSVQINYTECRGWMRNFLLKEMIFILELGRWYGKSIQFRVILRGGWPFFPIISSLKNSISFSHVDYNFDGTSETCVPI